MGDSIYDIIIYPNKHKRHETLYAISSCSESGSSSESDEESEVEFDTKPKISKYNHNLKVFETDNFYSTSSLTEIQSSICSLREFKKSILINGKRSKKMFGKDLCDYCIRGISTDFQAFPARCCCPPAKNRGGRERDDPRGRNGSQYSQEDEQYGGPPGMEEEDVHMICKCYFEALKGKICELEKRLAAQERIGLRKDCVKIFLSRVFGIFSKVAHYFSEPECTCEDETVKKTSGATSTCSCCCKNKRKQKHTPMVMMPPPPPPITPRQYVNRNGKVKCCCNKCRNKYRVIEFISNDRYAKQYLD